MKDPILDWLNNDGGDSCPVSFTQLRMPAEWEPVQAIWMSWPTAESLWSGNRDNALSELATLIANLTRFAPVFLNCRKRAQKDALTHLNHAKVEMKHLTLCDIPTDDVWCRDHGATFVHDQNKGNIIAIDWKYNGWGDKFPHELDADVAQNMALHALIPRVQSALTCEGGALEINEQGVLLTTESVLLNKNRNPDWSRKDVEQELKQKLGAQTVVWLADGLAGDDTDGHIDMIARFFKDDGIVTIRRKDSRTPDYRQLEENYEKLCGLRTPSGGRYDIACLPLPEPLSFENWRYEQVPVSYANFLIVNEGLLVPAYDLKKEDRDAAGLLGELFPLHEIISTPSSAIIQEGGSVHCLTQQLPKPLAQTQDQP